jgi:hypothetical protein
MPKRNGPEVEPSKDFVYRTDRKKMQLCRLLSDAYHNVTSPHVYASSHNASSPNISPHYSYARSDNTTVQLR